MKLSAIQIVRREVLEDRYRLNGNPHFDTLPSGRVFALSGTGPEGILGIEIDRDRIALMGPLIHSVAMALPHRKALWQAALEWARAEDSLAVQIVCSEADLAPLAELGFHETTHVMELVATVRSPDDSTADEAISCSGWPPQCEVLRLVQRVLSDSPDVPESIPFRSPESILDSNPGDRSAQLLTGRKSKELTGILCWNSSLESATIRYLGVHPDYRRQGWGRRLIREAFRQLALRGGRQISVYVDARNAAAMGLYRSLGFLPRFSMPLIFRVW